MVQWSMPYHTAVVGASPTPPSPPHSLTLLHAAILTSEWQARGWGGSGGHVGGTTTPSPQEHQHLPFPASVCMMMRVSLHHQRLYKHIAA